MFTQWNHVVTWAEHACSDLRLSRSATQCHCLAVACVVCVATVAGAAFASQVAHAAQTSTHFVVGTSPSVQAALETGSIADIQRMHDAHKLHDAVYSLAIARLHFNARGVLSVAERCEDKLGATGTSKKQLAGAFYCNEMARVAALSLGDAKTYLTRAKFGRTELLKHLSHAYGRQLDFGSGLDDVDLVKESLATPAMTFKWVAATKSLPITTAGGVSDSEYGLTVPVEIDGRHVLARLVPSAGYRAPVTVVVHRADAQSAYRTYGLRPLVDPLVVGSAAAEHGRAKITTGLALAKRVKLGPLVVTNLGVTVLQSDTIEPGVYLGASALRWFGGVAIGDGHIVLSKAAGKSCSPPVPMTYASSQYGNGRLLFPVAVGGQQLEAIWRPSFKLPVAMKAADLARVTGSGANGFTSTADKQPQRTAVLRVGEVAIHPAAVYTPRQWRGSYQVEFGAGLLRTHRIELRFGGEAPMISICAADKGRQGAHRVDDGGQ